MINDSKQWTQICVMKVNFFPVNMRIIKHTTVILDYNISNHSFGNVRPAPQQLYIDFSFASFLLSKFKYLIFRFHFFSSFFSLLLYVGVCVCFSFA